MIPEGSGLILVDGAGRKFFLRVARQMIEVKGLGVIDGRGLCDGSIGDTVRIGDSRLIVLRPSLRDLVALVERRTQVMLPKDSFQVPLLLDIGAGSNVLEAGAGSGALSLVLLHAVAPSGRVVSYELREDHAAAARRNVAMSDHADLWEIRVGDLCSSDVGGPFDAAVLDLPNPWDVLETVFKALRPGAHLLCYVPNVNQLEAAVRKMRDLGMGEVVAFETIQREMVVHEGGVRPSFDSIGHTGYIALARRISP
jgi:tRNA (adenine57-N1/adenine58-N1)-methyltransferase